MQVTIYKISPFDAEIGTTINFSWRGNQVFKNRCIIKDNDTNETVYDNTITSFKLEHSIDLTLATLINGRSYNAYITVFDEAGMESDIQSLGSPFICLKTPVFQFSNISDGQIIASSSYSFNLTYSQENGELLDSWSITVYTNFGTQLATSGIKYDASDLSHTISGFNNNTEYLIRGTGKTVNGILVDTGDINITVRFKQTSIFSILEPINVKESGAIHLLSNIVSAEGTTTNTPVYINGEYLDLTNDTLTFNNGFSFDDDFSLVLVFYNMKPNDSVLKMYDATGTYEATVTYRITQVTENNAVVMKSYFELLITNGAAKCVYYSNQLNLITQTDMIGIKLVRQNGLHNISAYNYKNGEVET